MLVQTVVPLPAVQPWVQSISLKVDCSKAGDGYKHWENLQIGIDLPPGCYLVFDDIFVYVWLLHLCRYSLHPLVNIFIVTRGWVFHIALP